MARAEHMARTEHRVSLAVQGFLDTLISNDIIARTLD